MSSNTRAKLSDEQADALRNRYRRERDKRLRQDGNDQYIAIHGAHSLGHYLDDPYVGERIEREPLTDEVEVIVVGGGFGGLLTAVHLRKIGVEQIRIVEQAADFGGTWYWNRYPGAACDIESYIYLPLLEETGYMPTERYSRAPEIYEHSRRIARRFDLYRQACMQTTVTEVTWDEGKRQWVVHTDRSDAMRCRYLVLCNGPLNRPKLPGIPGVEDFAGHSFHTSRWDYDYTGGDVNGSLDRLGDRTVGIIGTGATAVQCVPHLAEACKQLYVFQRTPSSIDQRGDAKTDRDWAGSLQPGWQKHRMDNFNNLVSGGYEAEDLVNDGWTDIIRNLLLIATQENNAALTQQQLEDLAEQADFMKMEQIRSRVDREVRHADTAEALKPWYRQFCKRPCFHDDYLAAFNRPNVTLVDTGGKGVERITADCVVADGRDYPLDCLIYATGFSIGGGLFGRPSYPVCGRNGDTLADQWRQGAGSYHGITVRGFPNMFLLGGPQGGFTVNFPHNMSEQANHISYIIEQMSRSNKQVVEPSRQAQDAWIAEIVDKSRMREQFFTECTPGYYNNEGQPSARSRQDTTYGAGSIAYFAILEQWRKSGGLQGMELS